MSASLLKDSREFAWAIGLDVDLHALYIDLLSIGDITRTLVYPWMAFRGTNFVAVSAIILVHNHPSGDPTPSEADIELTKAVIEGGTKLPRPLLDHVILGDGGHYGMAEKGLMSRLEREVREDIKEKKDLRVLLNAREKKIEEHEKRIEELEAKLKASKPH